MKIGYHLNMKTPVFKWNAHAAHLLITPIAGQKL